MNSKIEYFNIKVLSLGNIQIKHGTGKDWPSTILTYCTMNTDNECDSHIAAKFDPPNIVAIQSEPNSNGCLKFCWSLSDQLLWVPENRLNLEVLLKPADKELWNEKMVKDHVIQCCLGTQVDLKTDNYYYHHVVRVCVCVIPAPSTDCNPSDPCDARYGMSSTPWKGVPSTTPSSIQSEPLERMESQPCWIHPRKGYVLGYYASTFWGSYIFDLPFARLTFLSTQYAVWCSTFSILP